MVMKYFSLLFFIVPLNVFSATNLTQTTPQPSANAKVPPSKKISKISSDEFKKLYAQKDYLKISRLYLNNSKAAFFSSTPEIIQITSKALQARQLYLPAATFKLSLIRIQYAKENRFILDQIKQKKSLDGKTYPPELLGLYFGLYQDLSNYILNTDSLKLKQRTIPNYNLVKNILQKLEHEEGKVDKLTDTVDKHLNLQEQKKYALTKAFSIKMLSWQARSSFMVATFKTDIIITNAGFCLGGDVGYENIYFRYFASGCALIGQGVVQAESAVTYRQSGLALNGFIAAIGTSLKVSASGSELGLSLPVMFSNQKLTEPPTDTPECSAGCTVEALSTINYGLVMHGKWNFEKLYFLTEYGRYLKNDTSLFALGIGYTL
ncbi:MAG: hypothetical protein H7235_09395 [Bdellovibrionaceae bacterium]|nr:hypothetical protein [Pseudobdellovibrionaceae bacterium]